MSEAWLSGGHKKEESTSWERLQCEVGTRIEKRHEAEGEREEG